MYTNLPFFEEVNTHFVQISYVTFEDNRHAGCFSPDFTLQDASQTRVHVLLSRVHLSGIMGCLCSLHLMNAWGTLENMQAVAPADAHQILTIRYLHGNVQSVSVKMINYVLKDNINPNSWFANAKYLCIKVILFFLRLKMVLVMYSFIVSGSSSAGSHVCSTFYCHLMLRTCILLNSLFSVPSCTKHAPNMTTTFGSVNHL